MNKLKLNSFLLVVLLILFIPLESDNKANRTFQRVLNEEFFTFIGDSKTYTLQKNITLGMSGLKNYKIDFEVINKYVDNSVVTVSRHDPYSSYTTTFEGNFSLNPCPITFLSKTINSLSYWQNYAVTNSYHTNETNFRDISVQENLLIITSKNDNYGAWRCYVGNDYVQKWNWKTGWLEYVYLTDYLVNGSINYQFEYKLPNSAINYYLTGIVFFSFIGLGIVLTIEFLNNRKIKSDNHSKICNSFIKCLRRKIPYHKSHTTKNLLPDEIFEKLDAIEKENSP